MRLTTKGRYAVTAMVDIAMNTGSAVPLSDISRRNNISIPYLEQLFIKLKRAGLVKSVRGSGGGYMLSIDPDNISALDIIIAVDEDIKTTECEGVADCNHGKPCVAHHLWIDLSKHIFEFLNGVSLNQLAERGVVSSNVELIKHS
jgi:Rrf2 family iron-sulfur cluster assembly transcriptional regulator